MTLEDALATSDGFTIAVQPAPKIMKIFQQLRYLYLLTNSANKWVQTQVKGIIPGAHDKHSSQRLGMSEERVRHIHHAAGNLLVLHQVFPVFEHKIDRVFHVHPFDCEFEMRTTKVGRDCFADCFFFIVLIDFF
jgi:hypothetical protein